MKFVGNLKGGAEAEDVVAVETPRDAGEGTGARGRGARRSSVASDDELNGTMGELNKKCQELITRHIEHADKLGNTKLKENLEALLQADAGLFAEFDELISKSADEELNNSVNELAIELFKLQIKILLIKCNEMIVDNQTTDPGIKKLINVLVNKVRVLNDVIDSKYTLAHIDSPISEEGEFEADEGSVDGSVDEEVEGTKGKKPSLRTVANVVKAFRK